MKSAGQWPSRSRIWHPWYCRSFFLPESGSWGQALVSIPCCWANGLPSAVAESRRRWPALWRPERDDLASADVDEHAPIHSTCTQFTWLSFHGEAHAHSASAVKWGVLWSTVEFWWCVAHATEWHPVWWDVWDRAVSEKDKSSAERPSNFLKYALETSKSSYSGLMFSSTNCSTWSSFCAVLYVSSSPC